MAKVGYQVFRHVSSVLERTVQPDGYRPPSALHLKLHTKVATSPRAGGGAGRNCANCDAFLITRRVYSRCIRCVEYFHHGKPGKGSDNDWYERGWLIPKVASSSRVNLTFGGPATYNGKSNEAAFGVLNGRFVTWLISHFFGQFESLLYTDKRSSRRSANP